jgi:hypothetical protein
VAGAPELLLPLPLSEYSKVEAFGPDGRAELVWYRPGSPAAATTTTATSDGRFDGYAETRLRAGPRERYSVLTTASGVKGGRAPGGRAGRVGSAVSDADRRIERDLLLRLMGGVGDAAPAKGGRVAASRQQQLAEVSAAPARGGGGASVGLRLLVAAVAAILSVAGAGLWA